MTRTFAGGNGNGGVGGGGVGDVVGPSSSIHNSIPLFNGTTGKLLKAGSLATIDASGNAVFTGTITASNISGVNTGDQTSIVGITGNKSQFNSALTDGDFLFLGDVTQYTDEMARDVIASLIQAGIGISWSYDDDANTLTPTVSLSPFSTSDLSEGSNLYYTQTRFNSAFSAKTTSDLTEGSNLYYTQARFNSALAAKSTTDLVEGSNLYYTDSRVATKVATLSVDVLSDVNTSGVAKNEVLKWNGSEWVAAGVNESFTFSISSFTSNLSSTTVEIGSGTWLSTGAITFNASYLNGPPISAYIACSSWGANLNLSSPFSTVNSAEATAYPAGKDSTIVFTLNAVNGESSNSSITATFRNRIRWGVSTVASGYTSANVVGLSGSVLSNSQVQSQSINATTGQYLIFAFPSSYTSIHATGFLFNGVACPFQSPETVSVTNASGFTENYKVYRSTNTALGNSTLVTSTSSNLINPIYYGLSTVASGYSEANVEALATSTISNTKGRTFSVTAGASDYIVYAVPVRLGTVTFTVGGFAGGFQAPETVAITNVNGYTENYYVYRSTNTNLGATTVVAT